MVSGARTEQELDLPYVTGLDGVALETSDRADGVTRQPAAIIVDGQLWAEPLSEIHWDPRRGTPYFLTHRRLTIRLGWETAPEKFAQVARSCTMAD